MIIRCINFIFRALANRQRGLRMEERFWDRWLAQKGWKWPEEYRERLDPNTRLDERLALLIPADRSAPLRILDVGAGPLTVLGKLHPRGPLAITAVDPLGERYARLLSKHGVVPLVATGTLAAEELAGSLPHASFHLVHARNSIDHALDPVAAIAAMLQVVEPGCCVYLDHEQNEAEREHWRGLHQWNFQVRDGRFLLSDARHEVDLGHRFASQAELEIDGSGDRAVAVFRRRQ